MVTIPLRTDLTFFDLQVLLDGVTYTLEFRWNTRAEIIDASGNFVQGGAWFMNILNDQADTLLVVGIRVVSGWVLNAYHTGGPPGAFVTLDTSGSGIDPGLTELGDRVQLVYVPFGELAAVKAAGLAGT